MLKDVNRTHLSPNPLDSKPKKERKKEKGKRERALRSDVDIGQDNTTRYIIRSLLSMVIYRAVSVECCLKEKNSHNFNQHGYRLDTDRY